MRPNPDFRRRVLAGERLAGTFLNLGSPLTVELAGLAGYDWLLLDHEHGAGGDETLLHQLHAAGSTPAVPIVRIAANDPTRMKRVLDAGAHGVMIPYVSRAEEARAAVAGMRYPPRGQRGVARFNRAAGFGSSFAEYLAHAHEFLVTMPQIETIEGVEQADAIAAVDGVDVLFVGPLDLTTNLGISGQYEHPQFVAALIRVADAARRHGKAAGILALDPAHLAPWRALGYTVLALGSDGGAVNAGLRGALGALRAP